jgi:hypothetical protein
MDKPARLIREQGVHLLWLDDRRRFSEAEGQRFYGLRVAE